MTIKRKRIYEIIIFSLVIILTSLCAYMGITAVQKSMKLNLGFQVNPSFECKIVYNGNTIFCNTTKNGESLVVGDGVSLNGNNLTLNQNFSGLGAEFTLTIHNYTALKTYISVSGTGVNGEPLTLDAYSSGTAPNGNITITATGTSATLTFAVPPKTITLNLNGGTHASATNGKIKLDGEYDCLSLALSVVDDYIPTMTNYTFGGWYSHEIATTAVPNAEEGHTKYYSCNYFTDNSISLAEDVELNGPTTLYARWLPFTVGTYSTGTDKPTESDGTVTYTAFAGYKYITFANHATQESAYYSSSAGDIAARWIIIGAYDNTNLGGAVKDTTELGNNEILLLSEQTLISDAFDDDDGDGASDSGYDIGNWSDDGCTLRNWLNDETTNTTHVAYNNIKGFLTTTGLLTYKSYIQEKTIYTAWQGNATASDATSATSTDRVFLLATNAGYNNQVGSGTNYENAYGSQSFIMEKYLGSYTHNDASSNPKIFSFSGKSSSSWWLRSGYYKYNNFAYIVGSDGYVTYSYVYYIHAVRPSFILNLA